MTRLCRIPVLLSLAGLLLQVLFAPALWAQQEQQDPSQIKPNPDAVLMAITLRQTQEMNLQEMSAAIRAGNLWKEFPPEGVNIVGWYILMGIGHLVLLEVPPVKVRELNRALEANAYGIFRVEVHTGYDFLPVVKILKERHGK